MINRENYEALLLDLIEGQLSMEDEKNLFQFLAENPDLEVDLDQMDISLPVFEASFPLKESIKKGGLNKEINPGNFEQFCIARIEGDLPVSRELDLDAFLESNHGYFRVASIYNLLKLKADKTIEFPEKDILKAIVSSSNTKNRGKIRRIGYQVISIAASVAVLIFTYVLIQNNARLDHHLVAPIGSHEVLSPGETTTINRITQTDDSAIGPENVNKFDSEAIISSTIINKNIISKVTLEEREIELIPGLNARESYILPAPKQRIHEKIQLETYFSHSLAETPQIAGMYAGVKPVQKRERKTSGLIIEGLIGLISKGLSGETEHDRLTLSDIADAGIKGINSLGGAGVRFEREYNQEGELVSMAFTSRIFEFQRSASFVED